MKTAFLALALTFSFTTTAYAEVKRFGTIVADRCAQSVESNSGVTGVCFAHKVGEDGQYLQISYREEGQERVKSFALPIYSIKPGNSGITGIAKTVIISVLQDDMMFAVRGTGTVYDIESLDGDLLGFDFRASSFDFMLHTM